MPNGTHTIRAQVSCWQPNGSGGCGIFDTGAGLASFEVNHTPTAEVNVEQAADGSWDALVTYNFPETSHPSQRHLRLEWLRSGTFIDELQPTDISGTWPVDLPGCSYGAQEQVRVIATACGTTKVEDVTPAALPSCESSCSLECPTCVGKPIRVTNGNMRMHDSDPLPAGDLGALRRTYDSRGEFVGAFGKGWTSIFDAWATIRGGTDNRQTVYIATDDGERYFFTRDDAGTYHQTYPAGQRYPTALFYDAARNVFLHRAGPDALVRVFRGTDGRLVAVRHVSNPNETTITYDANGRPTAVADAHGAWTWTITTDAAGRVTTIAVSGAPELTWTYTYGLQSNLAYVQNADGVWRTYAYGTNGMEEARDVAGRLLEGHEYDAAGNALTSIGDSDDVEGIVYGMLGRVPGETVTQVTSASGRDTLYYSRYIAGKMRTVEVNGLCDCGAEDVVYGYDATGHIIREQNARGYITTRTFNGSHLAEEVTALRPSTCDPAIDPDQCRLTPDDLRTATLTATSATVTQSFTYEDANWPERPTRMRTSSILNPAGFRDQEFVYDAATGQVLIDRIIGWTGSPAVQETRTTATTLYNGKESAAFNPGGTFDPAWASLAQPSGARKVFDGPRTDVSDVTTYVHYPVDAAVPALLRGRLAAMRNAAGHVVRYENYNVFGSPTRVVDANSVVTETTYDAIGRPIATTLRGVTGCDTTLDPLCATNITRSRVYSANGPLLLESSNDAATVYGYDDRGRVLMISRGPSPADLRERIEYTYDPATGKKSQERLLGFENGSWVEKKRESYTYDTLAQLTAVTHADNASIQYVYGSGSLLESVRDENHATPNMTYGYDVAGRLEKVTQAISGSTIHTTYGYDRDGNLTTVTDPNGNVTSYLYDDFGQMLSQNSPVTGTTTYTYDAAGDLVSTTGANSAVTTRTYDSLGRVLTAVSTRETSTDSVSWTYDTGSMGVGRLAAMTDPSGQTLYDYERRGLLVRERKTIGNTTYVTSFGYDDHGNRSRIAYPGGRVVDYTFDFAGRPYSASTGLTQLVTSASYLPFGPPTAIAFGNGTSRQMTHDARYRLLTNQLLNANGAIASYDYGYDAAGNITRIHDLTDHAYDRFFGYDDLNRLTSTTTGTELWRISSIQYDAMGNILSMEQGVENDAPEPEARGPRSSSVLKRKTEFVYVGGTTPKIKSVTESGVSRPVTYDAAGNETASVVTRTYSPRNSLATVTDWSEDSILPHRLEYTYDGRGIRVTRRESPAEGAMTTATRHYFYTPELQLLSYTQDDITNIWRELEMPGNGMQAEIVWFAGQPVAQFNLASATPLYTFTDHLGTPILQTDYLGAVRWRAEYEPFGDIHEMRAGTRTEQPLRFPGQELAMTWEGHEENYNIFRWYRAGWGRYTQSDPIGLVGREYLYASNNPILHTDMLGLHDTGAALRRPLIRKACDTGTSVGKGIAGRALGLVMMIMSATDVNPAEFEANQGECKVCDEEQKKRRRCRPCIPPVGTLAFREDTNPASPPHRGVPPPHWKLYEMHQNPHNCRCFWHPIDDNKGGFGASPPPDGTVPITPAAGGGFW